MNDAAIVQIVEYPRPVGDHGAIPMSPLQRKQFQVVLCTIKEIKAFIERWHYAKSIHGVKVTFCFKLLGRDKLLGAAIFGAPAMMRQAQKYTDNPTDFIELRRLCCIDETPKNTESFFISKCLLWLKKNTKIKIVASYADLEFGHTGTIYAASNFKLVGKVPSVNKVFWNGRLYHYRTSREVRNGRFTELATKIQAALKAKEAWYEKSKEKNVYIYYLNSKQERIGRS